MEFDISYISNKITPWRGIMFLKHILEKTDFRELIESSPDLPQSVSNRGYKTSTIIRAFIGSIWRSYSFFAHRSYKDDVILGKIFV
jgi:hypothetical protein